MIDVGVKEIPTICTPQNLRALIIKRLLLCPGRKQCSNIRYPLCVAECFDGYPPIAHWFFPGFSSCKMLILFVTDTLLTVMREARWAYARHNSQYDVDFGGAPNLDVWDSLIRFSLQNVLSHSSLFWVRWVLTLSNSCEIRQPVVRYINKRHICWKMCTVFWDCLYFKVRWR